jgi:serine/threonine protein kinase/regulator of sirC expression with transglutaminase-like and TPR domain
MEEAPRQFGPYILIRKIGRGTFGVVWLAEKRTAIATTRFALKLARDEEIDLEAFKQEAAIWVEASGHPNVVPLIEADIYDGQVVLVSEYVPGGSLEDWLGRHGGRAPSVESACEMADAVLAGLAHLHERGIVHRDLKPDNILLRGETPCLADFGIARLLRSGSYSTNVSGTLAYMAPEAFDGKRNERTDIWSVGIILYQLLAGRLPYSQQDTASLVGAIVRHDPPPLPDSVPLAVRRVAARALERDPSLRYASAAEMRRELRQAMRKASPPIPATVIADAPKRSRAKVWALASGAAGILLIVMLKVAVFYLKESAREPQTAQAAPSEQTGRGASNQTANQTATPTPTPTVEKDEGADLRRWLGMLDHSEQVQQVLKETGAALAANPRDVFALRARSGAYDMSLNDARGKRDAGQIERLLTNPTRAEEFEARCYARLDLERLDDALSDCTRAAGLDPQYAWAWYTRGGVYLEKNDPEDALDNFNRALELNPRNTSARLLRGFIYLKKEEFDSAAADFNRVIELDPRNTLAYISRGKVEEAKEDYDNAIADCARAIELDPRFEQAYQLRSELYRKTDRDDLADDDARKAEQLHQQASQK